MNNEKNLFHKLFVFEMANNHMGDVEHGLRIIREIASACKGFDFTFAFKFQYRDIDTFIHPDFRDRKDVKYVKRFMETRLSEDQFMALKEEVRRHGFITMCTPFDERSVDRIERQGYDCLKVASCSFTDWPLLERVVKADLPVIASTAGTSLDDIDKVENFLEHRNKKFALMVCVGEYPTARNHLELNQITLLRERYPNVPIGYSTHEDPNNFDSIKVAVAKGACIFEKHVGVATDRYVLNAYSASPEQVSRWLQAARETFDMCGVSGRRADISDKERTDLRGLQRGVFARKDMPRGTRVETSNIFLAIPNAEGQLTANDLSKYAEYTLKRDLRPNEPVMFAGLQVHHLRERVAQIIDKVRKVCIDSKIVLPNRLELELSHHYGLDRFEEWGATIINCINREYCKKLIILLPGQRHPVHHHVKKEETFQVLYGDVTIALGGVVKDYRAGDMAVVERGVKHDFRSEKGAIFEEISTTHYKDDSFYEDEAVVRNKNRKTEMTFWLDWLYKDVL
ncbi:MAG: N-acetylneuraminate synthase family protein [Nitrospiraceae bacterium]|nr:N-acetylneuraminate synthase family protein [Nitrospiraceae bacterium]